MLEDKREASQQSEGNGGVLERPQRELAETRSAVQGEAGQLSQLQDALENVLGAARGIRLEALNQLDRLVPVHRVVDMTVAGPSIERELAMVKVRGKGEHRVEALRLADAFRARVIDATVESFVFEITGGSDKIDQFVVLMLPLGLVEVSRTGAVAIARGPGRF